MVQWKMSPWKMSFVFKKEPCLHCHPRNFVLDTKKRPYICESRSHKSCIIYIIYIYYIYIYYIYISSWLVFRGGSTKHTTQPTSPATSKIAKAIDHCTARPQALIVAVVRNEAASAAVFLLVKRTAAACYMGVSKYRGTPKWMVYNGKPYQNG